MRKTLRKRLVMECFKIQSHKQIFLLEELRWLVMLREYQAKRLPIDRMHLSYMKSFTRTIREHMPDLTINKIVRPDETYSGIIARAALYRLKRWQDIESFLNADNPCMFCKFQSKYDESGWNRMSEIRVELYAYCPKDHNLNERKKHWLDIKLFPTSSPLNIIARKNVTLEDLIYLSDVPWKIFQGPYGRQLSLTEPVRTKWRPYKVKPLSLDLFSKTDVENDR